MVVSSFRRDYWNPKPTVRGNEMSRNLLMCNFNLDGCVSELMLSRVYDFNDVLRGGYGKLAEYLKAGKLFQNKRGDAYDKLIMASMEVTDQIYNELNTHYENKFSLIDHHPKTGVLARQKKSSLITWNPDMSSAMAIYQAIMRVGRVDVSMFSTLAIMANTYETWKTNEDSWGASYALNCLFWHMNYFEFRDRYIDGVTHDNPFMTDNEKSIVEGIIRDKQEKMKLAVMHEIENNSVIFLNADQTVVSDFTLQNDWKKYGVFYIMYRNYKQKECIAVRKTDNSTSLSEVGESIRAVSRNNKDITGGGFSHTGSLTINNFRDFDQVIDIISSINNEMHTVVSADEDIPF